MKGAAAAAVARRRPRQIPGIVWAAVAALAVLAGVGLLFHYNPWVKDVRIEIAAHGIKISTRQDAPTKGLTSQRLDLWLRDRNSLPVLQSWWRQRLAKIDPDGSGLVAVLRDRCRPVSASRIESYQKKIAACDSDQIVGPLRKLSENRRSPFQNRAARLRISTPKGSEPAAGVAYTCFGGDLEYKRVRLLVPASQRRLDVEVRGGYPCDPGNSYPDLQLNGQEASRLLGRRTREIEKVYALII